MLTRGFFALPRACSTYENVASPAGNLFRFMDSGEVEFRRAGLREQQKTSKPKQPRREHEERANRGMQERQREMGG
eukprot:2240441-Rhodomonas_salina.1